MTLADERARQQENTNFDLNRRASLRPYRENLHGDAKGKGTSGADRKAESTDAPVRDGLLGSRSYAGRSGRKAATSARCKPHQVHRRY